VIRASTFEPAIAVYRRVFISVALIVAFMAIVAIAGFATPGGDRDLPTVVLVARAIAAGALLVVLRWGYKRLKRELATAGEEYRKNLDLAYRDALTGAATRSYFLSELREMLRRGQPLAYLQLDMDNLKVLNDAYGHGAGDTALVHLVRTLRQLLPDATIGRLGGDEFGIVLAGADNKAALVRLGDRILGRLGEPYSFDGRPVRLSATIGIAVAPLDTAEVDEIITMADLALYKGKKLGRACAVAFDAELVADERHKRFVERDLRAAILLNELVLHYQPIYATDGTTVLGTEALVRWTHPVRGRMLPSDFIGVAEQSDLIDKLGDWVLRRACLDLPSLPGSTVNINVSAVQLRRSDFADRVVSILEETGTSAERLIIEVTESLPFTPGGLELRNLAALRKLGIRVAIDDFGAGFTSLEYLRRFQFDAIKIDRSYIANLPDARADALIVSAILEIARSLDILVVAEGIETREQLEFLVGAGVTALQGYFLSMPLPLADIAMKVPRAA